MNGKKLQDMTEAEILEYVAAAIHDYLTRIRPRHAEFVLEDCLARQVGELKMLFRRSRGMGRRDALRPRDLQELDLTVDHFLPRMQEQARAAQMRYTREQTLWKIRGTSAEAQIKNAFHAAGMKVQTESQRYRSKVSVDLGGRTLGFYVGYKALGNPDTLPGIVRAVQEIHDAVGRIGGIVKLG